MAKKKKICPACNKEIDELAIECPECEKQLEILCWEIEKESGEKVLFFGKTVEESIREHLLSGKLKLSNHCRQYIKILKRMEEGKEYYGLKKEMKWKTIRAYANSVFSLQVLYSPVKACGKRTAFITWAVIGIVAAIGWNIAALLSFGANPIVAILWSMILLLLTPTVIGLAIGSFVVSKFYSLPPFGMAFRTLFAIVIGVLIGAAVGWTVGYLIGVSIGAVKKKILV